MNCIMAGTHVDAFVVFTNSLDQLLVNQVMRAPNTPPERYAAVMAVARKICSLARFAATGTARLMYICERKGDMLAELKIRPITIRDIEFAGDAKRYSRIPTKFRADDRKNRGLSRFFVTYRSSSTSSRVYGPASTGVAPVIQFAAYSGEPTRNTYSVLTGSDTVNVKIPMYENTKGVARLDDLTIVVEQHLRSDEPKGIFARVPYVEKTIFIFSAVVNIIQRTASRGQLP